jgi:NitT/TauT family transport system substrate-binding protein
LAFAHPAVKIASGQAAAVLGGDRHPRGRRQAPPEIQQTKLEDHEPMTATRTKTLVRLGSMALCAALGLAAFPAANAEMSEIHVSRQYGISYLPLMIMEDQKLIEKHAKAAGVDVKVEWS